MVFNTEITGGGLTRDFFEGSEGVLDVFGGVEIARTKNGLSHPGRCRWRGAPGAQCRPERSLNRALEETLRKFRRSQIRSRRGNDRHPFRRPNRTVGLLIPKIARDPSKNCWGQFFLMARIIPTPFSRMNPARLSNPRFPSVVPSRFIPIR